MKNSKITFEKIEDNISVKIIGEISALTQFPKLGLISNQTKILLLLDEAGYVNSKILNRSWFGYL